MLAGWSPLAKVAREVAEREGVTERTVRNRILAINHACGGGLVRSFERSGPVRKHWVHVAKLEQALRSDPEAKTAALDWMASRLEALEQTNRALKLAFRALKKQLAAAEATRESVKPLLRKVG